jgi:hypothetical protein
MTIGPGWKPCLASGFSGIAATFSKVTSGSAAPSATTERASLAASAVLGWLGAPTLTIDGVEDGAPGKTSDEA